MKTLLLSLMCFLLVLITSCAPTPTSTPTQVPPTLAPPAATDELILQRGNAARTGVYNFQAMREKPEIKWRTPVDDSSVFLGTSLLADGMLYTGGSDGQIYAFDAASGKLLWSGGDFEATDTATAIAGDLLIGSGQNQMVKALNRITGNELWSFNVGTFAFAPPLIVDDIVYIATYEKLYALDLKTGKPAWQTSLGSQMNFVGTPAAEGDTLYINVGGLLVALDRANGKERWRAEAKSQFFWLALGNGFVYVGNADGYFYAYEQSSGKERWKFKSSFGTDEIWPAPAVTEDTVYTGSRDQHVYALDANTGEKRWSFKTAGDAVGDPVISDGVVYLSDSNHALPPGKRRLHALDAATGAEIWTFETESTLLTTPTLGQGILFVNITGEVLALE